ncbi:MAG: hypothetical protein QOK48_3223, partial [Blastocatellia bacterium]|nr:hypothetical protein [Blastocatellia bacterium]
QHTEDHHFQEFHQKVSPFEVIREDLVL